jgi:hypothetical protein
MPHTQAKVHSVHPKAQSGIARKSNSSVWKN